MEHDRQLDAHDRHDGDRHAGLSEPVHPGRPARAAARVQAERHGAAQPTSTSSARRRKTACCRNVDFTGNNTYQDISQGASSFDRARNLQGTVNITKVTSNHTLRGGVDVRQAQRLRSAGGNPSGQLTFTNEFTRQASDTAQLTPSNLGLTMAAFMLGIPIDDGGDDPAPILLSQSVPRRVRPGLVAREREPDGQRRASHGMGERHQRRRQRDGDRLRSGSEARHLGCWPRRHTPGRRCRNFRRRSSVFAAARSTRPRRVRMADRGDRRRC